MAVSTADSQAQSRTIINRDDLDTAVAFWLTLFAAAGELLRAAVSLFDAWVEDVAALFIGEERAHSGDFLGLEGRKAMAVQREIQLIGGAIIMMAIIVVILNEVLTLDAVANSTGPFSTVIDSLTSTGSSALILLVIGLLVAAAIAVISFFGGGGF